MKDRHKSVVDDKSGKIPAMTEVTDWLNQAFEALEAENYSQAETLFEQVLRTAPLHTEALHYLAVCQHKRGDWPATLRNFQQAIASQPADPDLLHNLFTCGYEYFGQKNYTAAILFFETLIELNMDYREQAWLYLVRALKRSNQTEKCLAKLTLALTHDPDNFSLRLEHTFLLPQRYKTVQALEDWRNRFLTQLQALDDYLTPPRALAVQQRGFDAESPLFGIFAHGLNERDTTQKIAQIWEKIIPIVQDSPPVRPPASARIRIGLVSPSFWNHSTMHYFLGVIDYLSQQPDLELYAFYLGETREDHVTAQVRQQVKHFENIPWTLDPCLATLNRHQPDILLYLDIGQEAFLYSLAANRIAPIQCAMTGLPMTSGLRHIDYYLSGRAFESARAQEHYSEQLVLFDGPIVTYHPPPTPDPLKSRHELGLPEDKNLYLFPMSLFRVDPEFKEIIPIILSRDPLAEWLFIGDPVLTDELMADYQSCFPELCARIRILPWMLQTDFLSVMAHVNVIMDSLRLGAGNLAFQAFWMDAVLITLPGEFLRTRIGAGLYRLMDLDAGIAENIPDYIEKALEIATNPALRLDLKQKIHSRKHVLFQNPHYTQQMAAWFRQVHTQTVKSHG